VSGTLDSSDQDEEEPYQQNRSEQAAGEVTPVGAVGVSGQGAEEHKSKEYEYNGSKHGCILLKNRLRNVYSLEQLTYQRKSLGFIEDLQNARWLDR
jgi:hypothetical protein